MSWFVDASVMIAILGREDDWQVQSDRLEAEQARLWSAMARWEAIVPLAGRLKATIPDTSMVVDAFAEANDLVMVSIGEREASAALDAFARFGKGRHPAQLNMGDCFAYACAKTNGARLLYKGDDFARTDLA